MKKITIILGNTLIVMIILGLTLFYISNENKRMFSAQTEAFENMTVAMENVTTNYLLGEQQVVVKQLPGYVNNYNIKHHGINGCTLLGDGSISIILDVAKLYTSTNNF